MTDDSKFIKSDRAKHCMSITITLQYLGKKAGFEFRNSQTAMDCHAAIANAKSPRFSGELLVEWKKGCLLQNSFSQADKTIACQERGIATSNVSCFSLPKTIKAYLKTSKYDKKAAPDTEYAAPTGCTAFVSLGHHSRDFSILGGKEKKKRTLCPGVATFMAYQYTSRISGFIGGESSVKKQTDSPTLKSIPARIEINGRGQNPSGNQSTLVELQQIRDGHGRPARCVEQAHSGEGSHSQVVRRKNRLTRAWQWLTSEGGHRKVEFDRKRFWQKIRPAFTV